MTRRREEENMLCLAINIGQHLLKERKIKEKFEGSNDFMGGGERRETADSSWLGQNALNHSNRNGPGQLLLQPLGLEGQQVVVDAE